MPQIALDFYIDASSRMRFEFVFPNEFDFQLFSKKIFQASVARVEQVLELCTEICGAGGMQIYECASMSMKFNRLELE